MNPSCIFNYIARCALSKKFNIVWICLWMRRKCSILRILCDLCQILSRKFNCIHSAHLDPIIFLADSLSYSALPSICDDDASVLSSISAEDTIVQPKLTTVTIKTNNDLIITCWILPFVWKKCSEIW